MRQKNWRLIITGVAMVAAAVVFFAYMQTLAPKSNDAAAMLETVGQVSGVVGLLGIVMFVYGLVAKKQP
ncbi:MAG: hypothetical protein ACXWJW_04315 [Xanthobacteraceae bacterium]